MAIRKRGRFWYASFTYKGKAYHKSLRTEDRRLAKRLDHKFKDEVIKQLELHGGYAFVKFEDGTNDFIVDRQNTTSKTTWKRDKICLRHLTEYFAKMDLQELTIEKLTDYRKVRTREKARKATVNTEFRTLRLYYNYLLKLKKIETIPFSYIPFYKEKRYDYYKGTAYPITSLIRIRNDLKRWLLKKEKPVYEVFSDVLDTVEELIKRYKKMDIREEGVDVKG